jgi:hypothetical protein
VPQKLPNGVLTLSARWISFSIALSPNVFLLAQVITSRPGRNDPQVPSNQAILFCVRVQGAVKLDSQGLDFSFLLFIVFVVSAPEPLTNYRMEFRNAPKFLHVHKLKIAENFGLSIAR